MTKLYVPGLKVDIYGFKDWCKSAYQKNTPKIFIFNTVLVTSFPFSFMCFSNHSFPFFILCFLVACFLNYILGVTNHGKMMIFLTSIIKLFMCCGLWCGFFVFLKAGVWFSVLEVSWTVKDGIISLKYLSIFHCQSTN